MITDNRKSPSRKVNELDNRGTNYYIAKFWAEVRSKPTLHPTFCHFLRPLIFGGIFAGDVQA